MITYGSTTLTSYNTITKIEVYYYQSTSPTTQTGGSWSTTKPTWVDGRYVWQKIRTTYEGKLDNGSYYSESDPVNITGQQGATGTSAYSYKLNASDTIVSVSKNGIYSTNNITFSATFKQGAGAISAYAGRFKIETTADGTTWKTEYTSSGNEASKEFTIPDDIIAIKCSLYQSDGTTVLLDIVTVPVVKDGIDAIGLRDSIPYYLASDKDTGITRLTQGWTRYRPQLTAEKKYLWVYYVFRYSEGTTEPELIEIKDDLVHFVNNGDESPVESCVVDIEPVQDLNGYDHPWPAGGGVNLFDIDNINTVGGAYGLTTSIDGDIVRISGTYTNTSGGSSHRIIYHDQPIIEDAKFAIFRLDTSSAIISLRYASTSDNAIVVTITNVTPNTDVDVRFRFMLYTGSTAPTSYSPYSNICPITGWTKMRITRTGKNYLRLPTIEEINDADTVVSYKSIPIQLEPNTTYYLSTTFLNGYTAKDKGFYALIAPNPYDNNIWKSFGHSGQSTGKFDGIVTTNESGKLYLRFYGMNAQRLNELYANSQIQLEKGSVATEYEPYTGTIYSITFPAESGTVYGGQLNVTKGELTVDRICHTYEGGTDDVISARSIDTNNNCLSIRTNAFPHVTTSNGTAGTTIVKPMCNTLPIVNFDSLRSNTGNAFTSQGNWAPALAIQIKGLNTVAEYDAWCAENKPQISWLLATPITYTLTPQEITMLCNENNIFADTGQTSISYYDNQTSTDPYVDYSATSAFEVAQSVSDAVGTLQAPYKEVEWVESTGKQYVYLDWKPPIKTWGFEIDFISRNAVNTSTGAWNESTNVNGYGSIFGVRNTSGVNNCQLSSYSNGLLRIGNGTTIATGFKTDHSRQTIKLQGTTVTKTDGTTATVTRVDENTAKPYCNMTVFALYQGLRCQDTGGVSEPSSTRIYSLKFYDGTTLTVDLVGAIRKADGVTGLYDKVSRHFYPAPGMLFGNEVGNINDTDTVAESLNKADVNVTVVNKNRTRMWETAVPFNRLEDGQKITVTYSYGNVVNSIETAELPEWNESTTSGNARVYLKLTYPNGNKSEWIPCYYSQTARLTSHYGAGTPITFTYHEDILSNATEVGAGAPVVRGFFANPVYDSNYYDRRLHNNSIKAKEAITAYHLICGDEEGYQNINASVSFNLGYPILYASGGIATTKTATNTYEAMPGVNFTYTGTIQNGEADKMLWLKGTVDGNTFTVAFGDFLTTVTPTMEDGMYYIPLGIMASTTTGYFSSSNRLYAYIDGAFQPVDTAAVIRAQDAKNLATAVYGTCSTAADTPLKEVVCENFILFDGVRIQVAFENANSTNVPSLNVNNTGAKQILINQAIVSESNQLLWAEDAQMEFVYDGTYWVLQNAPYSLYGICSVTEEIPEKVIECAEAVICKGTTITVDFMYSNTSDNTVFNVANIAQKPLLVNGDVLKVNSRFNWHAGAIRTFYFDGQAWNMSDDIVSAYIDEYETEQNEDGIMVHPVGQKNTGWSIGSTLELLKNGVSYIKMWFDKVEEGEFSLPFIRIGKESGNHVLVGDDAVTIREDQKELAHYSSLGITFDDETPYKIGNDTTYIAFEDTDNDAKADSLRIVADSISFHSNGTEKDLRSELEGLNENIDLNAQAIEQNAEAIENTQKYIQIDPEVPSIKLATNDRNYLLIESNKLGFWVDANETAYMSQNQMNIPTASITNLLMQTTNAETGETIGQIGWVMRTNGHLSLKIMN